MSRYDNPPLFPHGLLTVRFLLLSVLILVLAGVFVLRGQLTNPGTRNTGPEKGLFAPDFSAHALTGEIIRLSELRGKPVVLNFFAGWCSPCKKEAPHLQAAYETRGAEVAFLGVTFQDTAATARHFADEYGLTFPILLDESEEIGRSYHVRSFPVTVFIRPDGVIHAVIKGPVTREFVLVMLDGMSEHVTST